MNAPLTLWISTSHGEHRVEAHAGQSVRDALDATALRVRAACGGTGSCGACVIHLLAGEANPPTLAEYQKLGADERAQGLRLACQLRAGSDLKLFLDDPAPPSRWRSIPDEDLAPPPPAQRALQAHVFGVAVDLGTTHIRVAFWDRHAGRRIATRRGPNPQAFAGADVLNRLAAAEASPRRAAELAKLARTAIVDAVRDVLKRDVGSVSPMLAEIGRVLVVGNTAMLALLAGRGGAALLDPDHWQEAVDCTPPDPAGWHAQWFMPNADIVLAPPVAGFVGSDLLADLIATGLTAGPPGSLLLDFGTNTEIALWDGRRLHVTSVPGGPAFEGVGIRHGMSAEPGAIHRVRDAAGALVFETIAEAPPHGYCGSGFVDAIAMLCGRAALKTSGAFAQAPGPAGYALDPALPCSAITAGDVDAFQRAKAATAAGMEALLRLAGLGWGDLRRLCICGTFGHRLDVANAARVGLLPDLPRECIELHADAGLAGCERALLAPDVPAAFARAGAGLEAHNLSLVPDYDDLYIAHLRLRPIRTLSPA
ncbi:MAG: DUF4445 domain-containing protein [Gammaproteobacteria bacterium]|nr:DUF4445 domain-containing protein [Gammaproteobacteria bacterium]